MQGGIRALLERELRATGVSVGSDAAKPTTSVRGLKYVHVVLAAPHVSTAGWVLRSCPWDQAAPGHCWSRWQRARVPCGLTTAGKSSGLEVIVFPVSSSLARTCHVVLANLRGGELNFTSCQEGRGLEMPQDQCPSSVVYTSIPDGLSLRRVSAPMAGICLCVCPGAQ